MSDQLISRLRAANPTPLIRVSNEDLRERILAEAPEWASSSSGRSARVSTRHVRGWAASGAIAAAVLVAVLVFSLSSHAPSVARAFPVLNGSPTLTPTELRGALTGYGVGPDNDGLDITHGHPVGTRWGTGYVLTNPQKTAICIVAPGRRPDVWGASCATQSRASSAGTGLYPYAYDSATRSARLIALFPSGAVVTVKPDSRVAYRAKLDHGVLATDVAGPEQITITISDHTTTARVTPQDAHPAYDTAGGSVSVTSTTTATGASTSTNP